MTATIDLLVMFSWFLPLFIKSICDLNSSWDWVKKENEEVNEKFDKQFTIYHIISI